MWEVLIPSIFSILKEQFDNIVMRITTWFLSFILCWLYMPIGIQNHLLANALPGLPTYTLLYIFYLVAATAFWQMFILCLEVMALIINKILKRPAMDQQTNRVEVDNK
ncbi:hypothetical protein A4G16_02400 [Mannheimia granulomatis]|uniref:Uncharacterized protein n=1 Tax=Mannheimia granulomatis TaxID=85402 RepID=A0A6G8JH48_9PAST|nr:hypothetical protein [Mannheimia granulomatis]QIM66303.1 hypothetical protein A4G16_02400 [Mannheimia granulomatis]